MKKQNCEQCIHFKDDMPWKIVTGICVKRKKVVNRGGYPCEFYELPPTWWQKLIRKWVQQ